MARPLVLTTQIPQACHRLDFWLFQIVTILKGSAKPPCVIEPSSLWLVLDAGSGPACRAVSCPIHAAWRSLQIGRETPAAALAPCGHFTKTAAPIVFCSVSARKNRSHGCLRVMLRTVNLCIDVQLRPPESPQDGVLPGGTVTATEQNHRPVSRIFGSIYRNLTMQQTSPESPIFLRSLRRVLRLHCPGWQQQGMLGRAEKEPGFWISHCPTLAILSAAVSSRQSASC